MQENMVGDDMRKKKNGYDEEEEVSSFIRTLLLKYPPVMKKEVVNAFRKFIEEFKNLELIWCQWEPIYKEGRSPEKIAKDLLHPPHENTTIRISEPREQKRMKSYVHKKERNGRSIVRV
jgi:hypothetical protein